MRRFRKLVVLGSGTVVVAALTVSGAGPASASNVANPLCVFLPGGATINYNTFSCAYPVGAGGEVQMDTDFGYAYTWYYPVSGYGQIRQNGTDLCMQLDHIDSNRIIEATCDPSGPNYQEWLPVTTGSLSAVYYSKWDPSLCLTYNESASLLDAVTCNPGNWYQQFYTTYKWFNPVPAFAVTNVLLRGSPGSQFVFWRGADGYLWEEYNHGYGWVGPTEWTNSGLMGSQPSVALPVDINTTGGNTVLVWRGTDGKLRFMFWNNGWHGPCNTGAGNIPADSRPSISTEDVGNGTVYIVAWKGSDNYIWTTSSPTNPGGCNGWSAPARVGHGSLGSVPDILGCCGDLFAWAGNSPQQHLMWYEATKVFDVGWGPLDSPPSVIAEPWLNSGLTAYYQAFWAAPRPGPGTDPPLTLWTGTFSYDPIQGLSIPIGGSQTPLQFLGALGGAPIARWDGSAHIYVVWESSDYSLWEATCDLRSSPGCWSSETQILPPGSLNK
jgi:hypothetical protein